MKWKTSISDVRGGKEIVRGYALDDLMIKKTFVESIYLILRGELPSKNELRMCNAILAACIDHGIGVASTQSARLSASTGNTLHAALAAGLLAFGSRHGGAASKAAEFFYEHKSCTDISALTASLKEKKIRIPGYGHKVLEVDTRALRLFEIAHDTRVYSDHCRFAAAVADSLNRGSGKKIPLNIDGALAAILLDMGFDPHSMDGFFIIGRLPGLVAHILEEMASDEGVRRLSEDECEYTGRPPRSL